VSSVAHLNELHGEFDSAGLSIVGVTGESKDKTEPWVEQHDMQYAYGYMDKGELTELMGSLGWRGYPSAALVDPKGTVVWTGHPASINGSLIKKHLKGASRTPVSQSAITRNWPEEARSVAAAIKKGNLADAREQAKKLTIEPNTVLADVDQVIERRVRRLRELHDTGDYLGFDQQLKQKGKDLSGLPERVELDELLKAVRKDRGAKAVMTAQKKLAKLAAKLPDMKKPKDLLKLAGAVRKISRKHPGTYAETAAKELLAKIDKRRIGG